ncbi:hypothetical protein OS493_022489 [Desmophyllum pertusum]|uniref:Uncharacterized protein n=1 Tax=Desmophyllum pertusum TaxID=174260 RepID=A0A9W9ZME8_9CNID|nr:hypothetical protein OS493_022489 [Desmophyllum pertusum]
MLRTLRQDYKSETGKQLSNSEDSSDWLHQSIAVAMVFGTVIVAERIGNVYCLDLHSKLQVKTASMKKAEMEAFVARQKVHIGHENAKNHSREEFKVCHKSLPAE